MEYDVCVLGSGPGGYVCAIRASQLGLKTIVVEKSQLGGVCLNVGCIPSKAMITAAHFFHKVKHQAHEMGIQVKDPQVDMEKLEKWKQSVCDRMSQGVGQLLKAQKVTICYGEAHFKDDHTLDVKTKEGNKQIKAKNFVISLGSHPVAPKDFSFDGKNILSSTEALALKKIPKKVLVVGGGYIGLEIGTYLCHLGSHVSVIERNDSILYGSVDKECSRVVQKRLKEKGVDVYLKSEVVKYEKKKEGLEVEFLEQGVKKKLTVDKVLVTVGRRPNTDKASLSKLNLEKEEGFIKVNSQRRTSKPHIFAIGDIAGPPTLAHKASYEGILVAEVLGGKPRFYDVKVVPSVIFVDPEVASVGLTEEECREKGYKVKVGRFPFAANGRAVSLMEKDGFVKVVADENNHVILGVHIVGPEASQLISEACLAIEMGAKLEDLAWTIHPHPTLSEPLMEASEVALGHPIHIVQR